MRAPTTWPIAMLAALALPACGDGGEPSGPLSSPAQIAAAIDCEVFTDHGMQQAEGRPPRQVGTCNLGSSGLTIQVLPDEAALEQWKRDMGTVCDRGIAQFHYVTDDLWVVNPTTVTDAEVAERIAGELGAELVSITC